MNKTTLHITNQNDDTQSFIIGDKYIKGDSIDIFNFLINEFDFQIEDGNSYDYSLKNIDTVDEDISIVEISENGSELILNVSNSDEVFDRIKKLILLQPVFLNEHVVSNIIKYNENDLLVILDGGSDIDIDDAIELYIENNHTDEFVLSYKESESSKPLTVLKNHRKDKLQNYDDRFLKSYNRKTYGDVKTLKTDTINGINSFYDSKININFDNFESHVRFGSALSKIINAESKFEELRGIETDINNSVNVDKNKNKKDILLTSFTVYEKYIYTKIYQNVTENEFELWVEKKKEEATSYDAKNNDLLLYHLPRYIIDNDEFGYLTNFCFLIGDYFDNIYTYIRSMSFISEYSINEEERISPSVINDVIKDLGFDFNLNVTSEDFKNYFSEDENYKKLSNVLSDRMIDSLPIISKMKGTTKSIEYLFNIFGIPRDVFSIREFSSNYDTEHITEFYDKINDWYLHIGDSETVGIDVSNTDYDWNDFSIELTVSDLRASGTLVQFTADNRIDYQYSNNILSLQLILGGVEIFDTLQQIEISSDEDVWTNITFRKSNDDFTINVSQKSNYISKPFNLYEIVNTVSELAVTHTSVEISDINVTEWKMYTKSLTDNEVDIHSWDIRSTIQDGATDELLFRVKFYNPITSVGDIEPIIGNFTLTLSVGITLDDFSKSLFINKTKTDSIFSNDITSEKIRDVELDSNETILSSIIRKNNILDEYEDSTDFGIYISENELYDKKIIREKRTDQIINPEWNAQYDYEFENFKNFSLEFKDLSTDIEKIYSIFNDKILSIIEEFIPIRSNLEKGVLIKNNILNKNKQKYEKRRAKSLEYQEPRFTVGNINIPDSELKLYVTDLQKGQVDISFENELSLIKEKNEIVLKTERSRYVDSIVPYDNNWKSPFLRQIIRGKTEDAEQLTAEQLREFLNYGAQILVI